MNNEGALKNIRIVLVEPRHPGNIGAAARAMKTMGLSALHLVAPREFPHPEAETRAAGAVEVLRDAQVHENLAGALGGCVLACATSSRRRDLRHEMMSVREAARELAAQAASHPVAVVFGSERTGLDRELAGLCQLWAGIPANPEYASLNLAAAVQIFAYELRLAATMSEVPPPPEFEPATFEQVDQLMQHFEQTMTDTGFFDPGNPKRLLARLRRLLARARLEAEEVSILRGFLNAVDKFRR